MRFLLVFAFLFFYKIEFFYSQKEVVRGKVFSPISLKKPKGDIYILEKGTSNIVKADTFGIFSLVPEEKKKSYVLEIIAGNYPITNFEYKSFWSGRKKPKSIVLKGKCKIDKEIARRDWLSGTAKLYLSSGIAPVVNYKKDKIFKRKYNIEYVDLGCDEEIYECISEYNFYIIKVLDIKYRRKWRKYKRKGIVGFKHYTDTFKACLN